ncbi:MAG: carboxypeptidase regulatory-like domain-containing protein, partial [Ginsengibacter sp.]
MRKNIFICIFLQVLPILAFCQTSSVKGILTDSSDHANIMYAVVSILKQEDTTLVAFARSDKEGKFQVHNIPGGSYIILISYPKYGDYVEKIKLSPGATIDLKNIFLTQKAKLLEEIIVRQAAIRIKGDTTEFTADSFHVRPNATVEDLLKELPGMQVDKNGQITAQGQKVQKVLVDGEEFFSDDPTIATRNLRADAVDKVQVFDKKSDQAEFTGIDDGQKTRTLNLKLKDNAKKGY